MFFLVDHSDEQSSSAESTPTMLDGSHGSNVTGVHSFLLLMAGPSFCTLPDLFKPGVKS